MLLFILFLLPGFLRVAIFYAFSPRIMRNVVYGLFSRNRLDIISPPLSMPAPEEGRPIVIFVTGGAWIIGYKAWGALLGKRLSEEGIITVLLDYRNFPQARVDTMCEDTHRGIAWTISNANTIGGNPHNVHLVGQSAGAHLCSLALIRELLRLSAARCRPEHLESCGSVNLQSPPPVHGIPQPSASILGIRSFIGISGVYDVSTSSIVDHFDSRGLSRDIFYKIFKAKKIAASAAEGAPLTEGSPTLARSFTANRRDVRHRLSEWSPTVLLKSLNKNASYGELSDDPLTDRFPRIRLLHGTSDTSVPYTQSIDFGKQLVRLGNELRAAEAEGRSSGEFPRDHIGLKNGGTATMNGGAHPGGEPSDAGGPPAAAPRWAPKPDVTVKLLQNKTHLDPFVIDPLKGRDTCCEEVIDIVMGAEAAARYAERDHKAIQSIGVAFGASLCPF